MDLLKLRADEDAVVAAIDAMARLRQLIALNYLQTVLKVGRDQVKREIIEEFKRKEAGGQ